jgi:capsular exopolysaccharide synthesis family protein
MTDKKYLIGSSDPVEENRVTDGSELTFQYFQGIFLRNIRQALMIFMVSIFIAGLTYFSRPPDYSGEALLMVNEDVGQSKPLDALIGPDKEKEDKGTTKDMVLIGSLTTAEQLVKELYTSNRRESLECLGNKEYTSPLQKYWRIATSSLLGSGAQADLKSEPATQANPERNLFRDALKLHSRINVETMRNTNLLTVSVSSPDPSEAVYLTNSLCKVYANLDIKRNAARYEQGKKLVSEMMQEQEQKLEDANRALSNFMAANKIYDFSSNISQIIGKLDQIESKYNDASVESRITKNSLTALEPNLSSADKAITSRISKNVDAQLDTLLSEVRDRESQYITLLREKGEGDPDVKAKRQELDLAKTRYQQLNSRKIASEIGYAGKVQQSNFALTSQKLQNERSLNQVNFATGEYSRLKQYYETQIKLLPPKQQEYAKLLRERDVVSNSYLALKAKLDETNIMLGSQVGRITVAEAAVYPISSPNNLRSSLLTGSVFGILLIAAYIGYSEVLGDSIKEELFFRIAGIATLTLIPYLSQKGNVLSRKGNIFGKIKKKVDSKGSPVELTSARPMFTDALDSNFAESFRTLRMNLDYIELDHQLKSILVSGTDAGEGKSMVCSNLGIAYALIGQKTVIIDCDLRRSSQHQIFNIKKEPGLTDYLLSKQESIGDHYLQPTHLENLFLLSAGSKVSNPNETLGSSKMIQLIKELEGRFDRVLFDTTPLFFSDAAQLAKATDGILLVARFLYSSKTGVKEYVEDTILRSHVIGVALIDSPVESSGKSTRYAQKYKELA